MQHSPSTSHSVDTNADFQLGTCLVQPRLNRIEQDHQTIQVEPKVMQVLVALATHAGEPVTREALFDTVWPEVVVTDDVLTRCVSELRKLFGDNARAPHVIETIPRVGYRLLAPISAPYSGDASPPNAEMLDVAPSVALPLPHAPASPARWLWLGVLLIPLILGLMWWLVSPSAPAISAQPLIAKPLTSFPGQESMAAFSPSGDRIAFSWQRADATQQHLYVSPFPALHPLQLTTGAAHDGSATWSPDGASIAFVRRTRTECGVFVVPALGGPARPLAPCATGNYTTLSWSPDGQWIAMSDQPATSSRYSLLLIDAATGAQQTLSTSDTDSAGDFDPLFSPDAKTLLFQRSLGEGQADLFLLTLDDQSVQRLTWNEAGIGGYSWAPDGKTIYFSLYESGTFSLWQKPMPAGEPSWLAAGQNPRRPVAVGNALVYEQWLIDTNIYRLDRAQPTPVALSPSTQPDGFPQFAPDGNRIVFTSTRSGDPNVWLSDAAGTPPQQLTLHDNTQVLAPAWSPDGQRIAYTLFVEGQAEVFVIDQPGTPPRRLTTATSNELFPQWSPDGQWIYFGSDRNGTMNLWKQPVGGGDAVQITTGGGFIARVATDGKSIYYTKEGATGLWRKPLPDGSETLLLPYFDLFTATAWALHDDAIYYLNRANPTHLAVTRYDLATGTESTVFDLGAVRATMGFSITPDAQQMLFVQTDTRDVDLMMLDLKEPSAPPR